MGEFLILAGQMLHRLSLWSVQDPQMGRFGSLQVM